MAITTLTYWFLVVQTTFEEYKGYPRRRLCLVGNLGSRFETGLTVAGKTWAKASLAVHSINQPGQKSAPKTEWYDLFVFDEAQARAAAADFQKGEMVAVVGAFRPNVYNSKTYNKAALRIIC
ncbi:single-strand binding protein family, partial [Haematococcus lacustris]